MDKSRELSLYYFDQLKDTDLHEQFEVKGVKLNSAIWIIAHLAVTENWLLLRSTGAEHVKIPWARIFGQGGAVPSKDETPSTETLIKTLNEVHDRSMSHLNSLTTNDLDDDNTTGFKLFGAKSKRDVINHAIRHEGLHGGHLGWLCKINGITTL